MEKIVKNAFCVMGKVGSTNDGDGFVQRLWKEANEHFGEISEFAKRDINGKPVGMWGAMTNFNFEFLPWEDNFSKGLYLAGVECKEGAIAPVGWKKWIVPGFTFLKVPVNGPDTFPGTIEYMKKEGIELVGAVQDFTDPETGNNYMLFPIETNDSKRKMIQKIKKATNQIAVCGFHCEHCFMGEWCGGCRSACNMCSFAVLSDENVCGNVRCAAEKGMDGCWKCEELKDCQKGFYHMENGWEPKANALFIKEHGMQAFIDKLDKADKIDKLNKQYQKQLLNYYTEDGKLIQYPSKRPLREIVLAKIAEQFQPDREYTEKDVNEIICSQIAFGDQELIRRELFQYRFLNRLKDGSKYWLEKEKK